MLTSSVSSHIIFFSLQAVLYVVIFLGYNIKDRIQSIFLIDCLLILNCDYKSNDLELSFKLSIETSSSKDSSVSVFAEPPAAGCEADSSSRFELSS